MCHNNGRVTILLSSQPSDEEPAEVIPFVMRVSEAEDVLEAEVAGIGKSVVEAALAVPSVCIG